MAWHDHRELGELTSAVMSEIDLFQARIGDQVATLVMYTSTFLTGISIGFAHSWQGHVRSSTSVNSLRSYLWSCTGSNDRAESTRLCPCR
mmetsp:Transcript_9610/g.19637  ORF Transcript_9610/g.19637 Transcript_9610/m.19637 type:complete len:90 (+) Transcript_9610:619-888(+)